MAEEQLVRRVAERFHLLIRSTLTLEQLERVDRYNLKSDPYVCATHDFIDANMPMAQAFEETAGREWDPASEEDAEVMNQAWALAKVNGFSRRWHEPKVPS